MTKIFAVVTIWKEKRPGRQLFFRIAETTPKKIIWFFNHTQLKKTKGNIGYALIQNILWMIIQIWLNTLPILVSLIDSKSWINMVYWIPSRVAATIKCFIVLTRLTLICIISFEKMKKNSALAILLVDKSWLIHKFKKSQSTVAYLLL